PLFRSCNGAPRAHPPAALTGGVQSVADEPAGQAAAPVVFDDHGVHETDLRAGPERFVVAAAVIAQDAHQVVAQVELEAVLRRIVDHVRGVARAHTPTGGRTVRGHRTSLASARPRCARGLTPPPVLAVLGRHVGDTRWAGAWPPSAVWRR